MSGGAGDLARSTATQLSRELLLGCDGAGELTFADERAFRLIGARAGLAFVALGAPGSEARAAELIVRANAGRVDDWELVFLRDGRHVTVSFSALPLDGGGAILVGTLVAERYVSALAKVNAALSPDARVDAAVGLEVRPTDPALDRIVVLNVNDREAARFLIGRMLRVGGFAVLDASTAELALEIAVRERPSVIVLDLQQPGVDVREVCRQLKANPSTASIAVLQTSATYIDADTRMSGLEIGADGFLVQPFSSQELIATIDGLVRLKQRELTQEVRAEALVEADKRKDDYLAMLAHELRNPVAAITNALEVIDEYDCSDERERYAREVGRRQVRVLAHLVDDLLDMSRVSRGLIVLKRAPLDLVALLRRAAQAAQSGAMAQRGQQLTVHLPEEPLVVHGDATRLQQIFTNLLDNASKYTDEGGHIELLVDALEGEGDAGQPVARVRIKDDGVGIPADALLNLFRLFYQVHASIARSAGGLGIGLTLVRTLTELHGGQVSGRSDGPNQGSEFEVRLPLLDARAHAAAESGIPQPRKATPAQRKRVLIVEDSEDNREMLADVCRRWGHEVITAADGFEAVRLATEVIPDVALIDLGLPGIDGYEVARRLQATAATAGIRLVALSGYAARVDAPSTFHVHLVKPADPQHLASILNEH